MTVMRVNYFHITYESHRCSDPHHVLVPELVAVDLVQAVLPGCIEVALESRLADLLEVQGLQPGALQNPLGSCLALPELECLACTVLLTIRRRLCDVHDTSRI